MLVSAMIQAFLFNGMVISGIMENYRFKIIYMGMWSLLAVLVVVVYLLFRTGHKIYHTRKARRTGSNKQTPSH
jgi:hypothetical protein